MDLHVMSLWDAAKFQPNKPTYVIRIFSSNCYYRDKRPLQKSPLFVYVGQYEFDDDDIYPFRIECGGKWFDEEIARQMIKDFQEHRGNSTELLVHCSRGENRSPGVAIAFNDIFEFGHDLNGLKIQYPKFNRWVYQTLLKVAKQMGVKRKL